MTDLVIALDGGLKDTGASANIGPEHLKSCLNYERGIDEGYTRVSGFSRWDGRYNLTQTTQALYWTSEETGTATQFVVGTTYTITTGDGDSTAICILSGRDGSGPPYIHYGEFAFITPALVSLDNISGIGPHSTSVSSAPSYVSTTSLDSTYRALVTALPMSTVGKIAGAHFFRNRLYAVADLVAFTVTGLTTLDLKEGAVIRKVTGSATIGTLVGYRDVTGTSTYTATLIVRSYTGVVPSAGNAIERQTGVGTYATIANFGAFSQSPRAALYYAAYNGAGGWNYVDPGRRMRYKATAACGGTSFLPYSRTGFAENTAALTVPNPLTLTPYEIRTGEYSTWESSSAPGAVPTAADIAANGGNAILYGYPSAALATGGPVTIRFGVNAAAAIPAGATVTGIKVTVRRANSAGVGDIRDTEVTLVGLTGPVANKADLISTWPLALAYADVTYGGTSDTWGNRCQTNEIRGADFGVRIATRNAAAAICIAYIDKVSIEISYREQTQKIYVYRASTAADITDFKVPHFTIDNGKKFSPTLADNLAEGTIVISGLSSVYARAADIRVGDELRTDATGSGDLIAYVNSLDEPITLPASSILSDASTRWTFTTCDPFAVDDTDLTIACSGVEEAYGFDGDYLLPIGTGLLPAQEVPRHAAYFQNQLYLGYANGIVQASDVGDVLQFDGGEDGAIEHGLSDRITGLLPLKGQALAVFTERSIRAIYSDGTGSGVEIKVISNSSGAIEYTVVDMGVPVFADFRGFATLTAVQEYGDFQRGRLTNKATRLMLSRLQFETRNQTVDKRPVAALPIRNKNQYRLFCKDGTILTLTLAGDALDPHVTTQRYFISGSNTDANAVRALALCAGTTEEGRDVAFFTVDNQSAMYPYAYQIDAGRSFDTGAIVAYLELHPAYAQGLSRNKKFDRVNVFGKAYGSATISACFGSAPTAPSTSNARSFVLGATGNTPGIDPDPYNTTVEIGLDAYGLSCRFDSSTAAELPHTLQVLDVTYSDKLEKQR